MIDQVRKSVLCPNCRKLVSSDEPRCPYCGVAKPGAWWKNNAWTQVLFGSEQVIWAIIYTNVFMYVVSLLLFASSIRFAMHPFSFLAPGDQSLMLLGATGTFPIDRLHRWWSVISANYLHSTLLHILFNMIALRQLGSIVLQEYGSYRTIVIYTLSGVAGFCVSYAAGIRFTIGASAAVCGLIGAALYYGHSRGGVYGQAVFRQVVGWLIGLLIIGLMPGINNWAHGGGVVAGAGLGLLLKYQEKERETLLHKLLAGVCAAATAIVLAWAVLTSIYFTTGG